MNGFTFWKSFFESGNELPKEQEAELYRSIVIYAFLEEEPTCSGAVKASFNALKPNLDKAIKRSKTLKKTEATETKTKPKQNQTRTKTKPNANQNETKNDSSPVYTDTDTDTDTGTLTITPPPPSVDEMGYSPELSEAVKDWLSYKKEKRENYKLTGLKTLLTQIKQYAEKYGNKAVIDLIHESMSSNYKGIVFDRLSKARGAPKKDAFPQRNYDYDALEKKLLNGGGNGK